MKKIATLLLSLVMLTQLFLVMPRAQAEDFIDPSEQACEAIGFIREGTPGNTQCNDPSGSRSLTDVLRLAISLFSILIGFAAVVMIIIGAFKYITSNGDTGNINSAKNTILYAVIGLVVAATSQVLVRFVFKQATAPPPPKLDTSLVCPGTQTQGSVAGACE